MTSSGPRILGFPKNPVPVGKRCCSWDRERGYGGHGRKAEHNLKEEKFSGQIQQELRGVRRSLALVVQTFDSLLMKPHIKESLFLPLHVVSAFS